MGITLPPESPYFQKVQSLCPESKAAVRGVVPVSNDYRFLKKVEMCYWWLYYYKFSYLQSHTFCWSCLFIFTVFRSLDGYSNHCQTIQSKQKQHSFPRLTLREAFQSQFTVKSTRSRAYPWILSRRILQSFWKRILTWTLKAPYFDFDKALQSINTFNWFQRHN